LKCQYFSQMKQIFHRMRYMITNYHNNHLWSYENPHGIIESQHQHKCNFVQCMGWYYWNATSSNIILEDIPLDTQSNVVHIWWSSSTAREFLNNNYINKWIGRGRPIAKYKIKYRYKYKLKNVYNLERKRFRICWYGFFHPYNEWNMLLKFGQLFLKHAV